MCSKISTRVGKCTFHLGLHCRLINYTVLEGLLVVTMPRLLLLSLMNMTVQMAVVMVTNVLGLMDSTSIDITPDSELPISNVQGAPPPERPYSPARHDSCNSNGSQMDDLLPISPCSHGYSPQDPTYSPHSVHHLSPWDVPPPNPYSQPPPAHSHLLPPHQSPVAPPLVPAKFASIMNAYPEPPYAS